MVSVVETNALPTAQDINSLSAEAMQAYESFMRQSYSLRLEYEFAGRFLSNDNRESLLRLAQQANDKLTATEARQSKFKREIEDYEGDDWEARFGSATPATGGSTGLWRKLTADVYFTSVSNCQVGLYLAVSADGQQKKDEILKTALNKIEVLEQTGGGRDLKFLKAKVLGVLAADDLLYRPLARKEFEQLEQTSKKCCSDFQTTIEKIKLLGEDEPGQLETLAKQFSASQCKNDLELVLSFACLQYRLGRKRPSRKLSA